MAQPQKTLGPLTVSPQDYGAIGLSKGVPPIPGACCQAGSPAVPAHANA